MISALIDDATTFGTDMTAEEEDDITVVVVKVLWRLIATLNRS